MAAALALVVLAAVVGRALAADGTQLFLGDPPLLGSWGPHVGWGTPLALACLVAGLRLQQVAAGLPWRRLLLTGWLLNLAWLASLALVDGFRRGWADVLLDPNEYLHDLPRITDPGEFLRTFTDFIAFSPTVDGTQVWTTHVAAHPPLATLVFWGLDRGGLGGGAWAGALCILVSSVAAVAMPSALRELGAPDAARRLVPFAALFPGAVFMAVSADGLFAGAAVAGLALVCRGAGRRHPLTSLAGGLLLGAAVFLNYGLLLFGLVVIAAGAIGLGRHGWRRVIAPWASAVVGLLTVVGLHLLAGFSWWTGLAQLRIRYYQGIAAVRPYSYFIYANLAAWVVACSPLLALGTVRSGTALVAGRGRPWSQDRVVALLALAGVLAAVLADLSGLSKAETERIWLAFGVVACSGLALLRGRVASWALLGSAGWALLVNHLVRTGW
ncbi:hypothetical protein ACFFOM_20405 [Microlunatus capsulatus]|uniref:Integral membrane protein n=1 Tax=Microlunatus capsulatus TaxID=99117 RepID=A0ABS4ZDK3_9ACTN|nr:hypothetical protein [Microlunatus capsulatus]MBP2419133.1 hypothetical protein [Microlunatus capsulatus]